MKKIFYFFFFCLFVFSGYCENLTFAIFSDCHLQNTMAPGEKILSRIIANINQHPEIEFAACLGDVVGYPSSIHPDKYYDALQKYLRITEVLKIPLYTVPGNHDLEGGKINKNIFQQNIGKTYFSVEKDGFLLIFLDSEDLSDPQIDWLKNELNKQGLRKIVFMHKPLLPAHNIPNHIIDLKTAMLLKTLFEQKKVIAIISGHDHLFYIKKTGKITQIISGGAGGKLVPAPENGKSAHHYCIITVTETDNVSVITVPIDPN
ncbi:MAG: metallophosphoesterase [bacterium]|nr:metallophosphoesterase [bacterium]